MRAILAAAFLLLSNTTHAESRIPASDVIQDRYDVVVYGVVEVSNEVVSIQSTTTNLTKRLHLVSIRPYRFLPELSPHYFWAFTYSAYVSADVSSLIHRDIKDYTSSPRFWGIRRTLVFGEIAEPIVIRGDETLEKLEAKILNDLKDSSRVRPLDLRQLEKKLSLAYTAKGDITFTNHSSNAVWLHEVSGEYLSTGKSDFTYYITGLRQGSWVNFGYGLSGPDGDNYAKFNLTRRIEPGASVTWKRDIPKDAGYEGFRVEITVYPDEARLNGLQVVSDIVRP
jgi:hypothetical protein